MHTGTVINKGDFYSALKESVPNLSKIGLDCRCLNWASLLLLVDHEGFLWQTKWLKSKMHDKILLECNIV